MPRTPAMTIGTMFFMMPDGQSCPMLHTPNPARHVPHALPQHASIMQDDAPRYPLRFNGIDNDNVMRKIINRMGVQ